MCLIISSANAKNVLTSLTEQEILTAATRNDDGVGVMYMKEGGLYVEKYTPKGFNESKALADFVRHHANEAGTSPFASHLRFKTHGPVDDINTHPHPVILQEEDQTNKSIFMMHNGVIGKYGTADLNDDADSKDHSDTVRFVRKLVRPLLLHNPDLLDNPAFQILLSDHIGASNKLCFLDSEGHMVIINPEAGGWRDKVWLSTPSYVKPTYTYQGTGAGYGYGTGGYYDGYSKDDFKTGGRQTHQAPFRAGKGTLSAGSYPLATEINTTVEHLQTYYVARSTLTAQLSAYSDAFMEKMRQGKITFKSEPNFQNTHIVSDIRRSVSVIKEWLPRLVQDFTEHCPVEAAEILYYLIDKHTFDDIDFQGHTGIQKTIEEIKERYSFVETCDFVSIFPKEAGNTLYFMLNELTYPFQKKKSESPVEIKQDKKTKHKQGGKRHDKRHK